ncbi:YbbR-like domain-containing protein [Sulfobacillus harzensis]|uniref:YbbR domain-containing protein n=1 Tax=Sulfobacillus harzensis TaxID=2729629 RepID=A0A7Y0L3S0_9FIRM|nr:CdaR family protein [Sulfobacillus harzensis]NMP22690.1 hypothetical protein [Sulfobacillus harzensis]
MTDRLLENNTFLKILSVIVAIFIWFRAGPAAHVPNENHTIQGVAVGWSTINPHLTVLSLNPGTVTVQISGPPSSVNSSSTASVSALVNLSNIKSPGTYLLKVSASVPAGVTPVSVTPSRVEVTVARIGNTKRPVEVHLGGQPAAGYELSNYSSSIKDATVSGPTNALRQVKAVAGTVSLSGHNTTFSQDVVLEPVNAAGRVVPKVQVDPPTAAVTATIKKKPPEKVLPVVSKLTGQPASGYTVSQINVYPSSVTVSGTTQTLAGLNHIFTVPVNVSGATKTITESVPVQLPSGTSLVSSGQVTVTVTITKGS